MEEKWAYSGLKVGLLASLPVLRSVLDVGMWCLRGTLVNGGRLGNDGGGAEFMHRWWGGEQGKGFKNSKNFPLRTYWLTTMESW